jgi:hypothetical protein
MSANGVGSSGTVTTAMGASMPGPLEPGQRFMFTVTVDAAHRFFSLAAMLAPTNDTFLAFDPGGIALLDASGTPRSNTALAADVQTHLYAWDAGTEANQSGAGGPDQVGLQAAPNTGANEGSATVRTLDDPVWRYPGVTELVRVTITPEP